LVNKALVQVSQPPYIVSLPATQTYTTDAEGYITFSIKGLTPGAAMLRYQAPGDTFDINQGIPPGGPRKNFYFGLVFYNSFRVLPGDNFDDVRMNKSPGISFTRP
jgi:hypothetical protein